MPPRHRRPPRRIASANCCRPIEGPRACLARSASGRRSAACCPGGDDLRVEGRAHHGAVVGDEFRSCPRSASSGADSNPSSSDGALRSSSAPVWRRRMGKFCFRLSISRFEGAQDEVQAAAANALVENAGRHSASSRWPRATACFAWFSSAMFWPCPPELRTPPAAPHSRRSAWWPQAGWRDRGRMPATALIHCGIVPQKSERWGGGFACSLAAAAARSKAASAPAFPPLHEGAGEAVAPHCGFPAAESRPAARPGNSRR